DPRLRIGLRFEGSDMMHQTIRADDLDHDFGDLRGGLLCRLLLHFEYSSSLLTQYRLVRSEYKRFLDAEKVCNPNESKILRTRSSIIACHPSLTLRKKFDCKFIPAPNSHARLMKQQ